MKYFFSHIIVGSFPNTFNINQGNKKWKFFLLKNVLGNQKKTVFLQLSFTKRLGTTKYFQK